MAANLHLNIFTMNVNDEMIDRLSHLARLEFNAEEKTEIKNPARQLIQLKLDALGGNAASAG